MLFHREDSMKATLIDTDILSMYFRGNDNVTQNINQYRQEHESLNINIIIYYAP